MSLDRRKQQQLYRRTLVGLIGRMYERMFDRVRGIRCNHPELYKGLNISSRSEFQAFALKSRALKKLYKAWVNSDFQKGLRPTPDRINSDNPGPGYVLSNIHFKSFADNMRRGVKKRLAKKRKK